MDRSNVIQIDATIITGMLIFLTIADFKESWKLGSSLPSYFFNPLYKVVIIIIPFSLSAALECLRSYLNSIGKRMDDDNNASSYGLAAMFCGFVVLIILLASHAVIRFNYEISSTNSTHS